MSFKHCLFNYTLIQEVESLKHTKLPKIEYRTIKIKGRN